MFGNHDIGSCRSVDRSQLKCLLDRARGSEAPYVSMKIFVGQKPQRMSRCMRADKSEMDLKFFGKHGGALHFAVAVIPLEQNVLPFNPEGRARPNPVVTQFPQELDDTFEVAANAILRIALRRCA